MKDVSLLPRNVGFESENIFVFVRIFLGIPVCATFFKNYTFLW